MDPWLPGSQLQRVVEREREREREREATVDPDRTDVDSMPDLVTVGGTFSQLLYIFADVWCNATQNWLSNCQIHGLVSTLSRLTFRNCSVHK